MSFRFKIRRLRRHNSGLHERNKSDPAGVGGGGGEEGDILSWLVPLSTLTGVH